MEFQSFGGYFMNFSEAGAPLKLFTNSRGLFAKTMDCGLITRKLRGFIAKMLGNIEFQLL
jgi:hypothetical protein